MMMMKNSSFVRNKRRPCEIRNLPLLWSYGLGNNNRVALMHPWTKEESSFSSNLDQVCTWLLATFIGHLLCVFTTQLFSFRRILTVCEFYCLAINVIIEMGTVCIGWHFQTKKCCVTVTVYARMYLLLIKNSFTNIL